MTWVAGQKVRASDLQAAFDQKLDAGLVSAFSRSVLSGATQANWFTALGLPPSSPGGPNGVATLDGAGHVPLAQLPTSVTGGIYPRGTWDASTNNPALTSGLGNAGDLYIVSVPGTTSVDGNASWAVGDWIFFDGNSHVWRKINASGNNTTLSTGITDSTAAGRALLTAADVPTQRQLLLVDQATLVSDADQAITADMTSVAWTTISAARAANLPAASTFAVGQSVFIYDESGNCSPTNTISVNRNGTDTINGGSAFIVAEPYGGVLVRKASATKWTAQKVSSFCGVRTDSTGSRTYTSADNKLVVRRTAATAMSDTISPAFGFGWSTQIHNSSTTALLTLTPSSGTIAGLASIILPPGSGVEVISDGSNLHVSGSLPQISGKWLIQQLTNPAALSSTTVLASGFNEYEIEIQGLIPTNVNETVSLQFHSGGVFASTNYACIGLYSNTAAGSGAIGGVTTDIRLSRTSAVYNASMGLSGFARIRQPQSASFYKPLLGQTAYMAGGFFENVNFSGVWQSNAAIDGFQIYCAATIASIGAVNVFGLP